MAKTKKRNLKSDPKKRSFAVHHIRRIKDKWSRGSISRKVLIIIFAVMFAGVGVYFLLKSHATTYSTFASINFPAPVSQNSYKSAEITITPLIYQRTSTTNNQLRVSFSLLKVGGGNRTTVDISLDSINYSSPAQKIIYSNFYGYVSSVDHPSIIPQKNNLSNGNSSVEYPYSWTTNTNYKFVLAQKAGDISTWTLSLNSSADNSTKTIAIYHLMGGVELAVDPANNTTWTSEYGTINPGCNNRFAVMFSYIRINGSIKPLSITPNQRLSTCNDVLQVKNVVDSVIIQHNLPSPRSIGLAADITGKGYGMDGYGGVWPLNGASDSDNANYWPGWQIAKRLVVKPDNTAAYMLDGFGGVHAVKIGTNAAPIPPTGVAYFGWDIARDLVITDWAKPAGYTLDGWGGIHPFGGAPALNGGPYWNNFDIGRRLVVNSSGSGGYVMDGWGGLHAIGNQPPAKGGPYWSGQDIARTVLLNPTNTGGYVLDGSGGIHPFAVGSNTAPATPTGIAYWSGNTSVATDLVITDWTKRAGYTLDYRGGIHSFGGAPTVSGNAYWP